MSQTVVPTPQTKKLATRLLAEAKRRGAYNAALAHYSDVSPGQEAALVAVLLTRVAPGNKPGPKPLPNEFNDADRHRGYSQYRQGSRTEFAIAAYREYQRLHKRRQRRAA